MKRWLVALALLAAVGCGGGSGSGPAPVPTATGTPFVPQSPNPPQHLYVGYASIQSGSADYAVAVYQLPLTSASAPVTVFPGGNNLQAFAVDEYRGTIAEVVGSGTFGVATLEIVPSIGSPAAVSIPPGPATLQAALAGAMDFDPGGNLWIPTTQDLREFSPPFQTYSTVATVIPNGVPSTSYANFVAGFPQFDPSGTMYVSTPGALFTFSPPAFSAGPKRIAPGFTFGQFAFDGLGNTISTFRFPSLPTPAPSATPLPQTGLGVFSLPLSSLSTPQFLLSPPDIPSNLSAFTSDEIGGIGNVYIGDSADGSIFVYPLPLTPSSTPALHVPCPAQLAARCTAPTLAYLTFYVGP
ncbi:MAG: hypothetical protein JO322_11090 [Candidatus Eremiobacteraeota bacterium]|nr:hypothetical protein [Candidatus Eremiobacteraeota bacterium]